MDNFSASNGWLCCFLARHAISSAVLCGEAGSVNQDTVDDWTRRLPDIIKDYDLDCIYNCDETGLMYRTLPSRSMVVKGASATNGKLAKDRISVLLCCSATGEKIRPLVIGRAKNLRCMSQASKDQLTVTYARRSSWLRRFNNMMSLKKKKALLFLDNCSSHPPMDSYHVKYFYLQTRPPGCSLWMQALFRQ